MSPLQEMEYPCFLLTTLEHQLLSSVKFLFHQYSSVSTVPVACIHKWSTGSAFTRLMRAMRIQTGVSADLDGGLHPYAYPWKKQCSITGPKSLVCFRISGSNQELASIMFG